MKFNRQMDGKWLLLPLVLIACQANASDADAQIKPAGVATYGQLDELRSQNALLAEALKNAELKSKLKAGVPASLSTAGAPAFPGGSVLPPAAPFPSAPAASAALSVPAVASAEVQMVSSDRDNRLVALLSLQNGRQVKVRVGSTIPGIGTVQSISVDEVVVRPPKGEAISLPFGSEPIALPAQNSGQTPMPSMMGMPSISTVMPPMPRGGR
jgi:type IV pilus biogenesis protein PilP